MTRVKLSAMMFLQFMMLPVWFVPMFPYVDSLEGGAEWTLWCGMIMGFGTFLSPLFGMFADRLFNAERVLAFCNAACAALLATAFFVRSPALLFIILLAVMCFCMPTWALTATIAMANAAPGDFAKIRVFGTVGWVASGVFSCLGVRCFGLADFDATPWIFVAGAGTAALAALLAFFALPPTPPSARGAKLSIADALGLRALVLFRDPAFAAFAALVFCAMIPFQWYVVYNPVYLKESGFSYLTVTQNLGQVGEIGFMLLVPVIVRKFGYRNAMVIALGALTFRYVCFGAAAAFGWHALDFGGILIHGLIFGLLIVGSQMYVDEVAPKELRNQAQGLVNLLTAGAGVFASNALFDTVLKKSATSTGAHAWTAAFGLAAALAVLVGLLMRRFLKPDGRGLKRAESRTSS